MNNFALHVKSTIDKLGVDLADSYSGTRPEIKFIDMDNMVNQAEDWGSDNAAFVWELETLVESPRDPLYAFSFNIGVKTTLDPGNYDLLDLMGEVASLFAVGDTIDVMDYSGLVLPTNREGYLVVTSSYVNPQQFDKSSGVRLVSVSGRAQRVF